MKLTQQTIEKFLEDFGCDGWSIIPASDLAKEYGFPLDWLEPISRKHVSDRTDPKRFIYDPATGKELKSIVGIHSLTVLVKIANEVGAQYEGKLGRGSQARACTEGIRKALEAKMSTHNYLFDVKIFASVRVDAEDEKQARKMLDTLLDCVDVSFGTGPDRIEGEASIDGEADLIEVDGETPEDDL